MFQSQLHAEAIKEYLAEREEKRVTEQLDAIHAAATDPVDPALAAAQLNAIDRETW